MSDSDMDLDFDSEEELQELRKIRQVMECDDNSLLTPQCSTSSSQQSQVSNAIRMTLSYYIELSLVLNKQQDEKLMQVEKSMDRRLQECREKLKKVRSQNFSDIFRSESFRFINCGRPYFKDIENYAAPDNEDALIMAKNDMYDFSNIVSVPGWTVRDKTQLWHQIERMTRVMKKKEIQSKIAGLKRDSKNKKFSEKAANDKKINKLNKEMTKLDHTKLDDMVYPIEIEYDWEEVTHSLDRRHSATEYRALWKLYLHPSINKSNWSKTEHQLLQKVALEHELHNWESIAQDMGNNRTGYQCFVYFRTNMNNTFTGKKWTDEEVDYLLRLIEYYKEDNYIPWVKVTALMENRTKIQIYNKYTRLLEQRKGRFLLEEDAVLLTCADDFGPNYKKMAQFLPGRSVSQIRVRYQALSKKRVSTVWTVEEDRKLLQLLSNQDTAGNYASIAKYFPGKDRIHIRARYVTLLKWMRRNPNVDIIKAPRRGARRLGHGKASENLNVAVENLKTRIETEADKKRTNKINDDSSEDAVEDSIIASFVNERKCKTIVGSCYDGENLKVFHNDDNIVLDAIDEINLHKILLLLRVKMNKELYEKSNMYQKKTKFITPHDQVCVVKVKSYSKKNKIKSIKLNTPPDVWGNHTFRTLEYVLPPHYATITGCRTLMKYVVAREPMDDTFNFSNMMKRNVILREHLDILMERFNTLFLWPLLLSNEGPNSKVRNRCFTNINEIPISVASANSSSEADIDETGERNFTTEDTNQANKSAIDVGNLNLDIALESGNIDKNIEKKTGDSASDSIYVNIKDSKYCLTVTHM